LLVGAGTSTGVLSGLIVGVLGGWLPDVSTAGAITAVVLALALDGLARSGAGPSPPARRRQVPQTWGRIMPARAVAVLYGAQLGVGPLTFLVTWLWWATMLVAATHDAAAAALTGAAFGFVRLLAVTAWPERRLRRRSMGDETAVRQ
jgi:hypothetical protein